MRAFLLGSLAVLCLNTICAQGGGFNPSNLGRSGGGGAPNNSDLARDTSDIYYFYSNNLGQEYELKDTLLETYFLQYDPIRRGKTPYAHLGLPGSAAMALTHQIPFRMGFDVGMNQYDIYRLQPNDLKYYRVEQAYSRAGFSQGLTQQETTFNAEFAREFAGNFTLSFDYRNQNNTGFYSGQNSRNTALAINGWLHSDNNRYRAFFNVILNQNDQLENGGISSLPKDVAEERDTVDNPILASTFLDQAASPQNRYRQVSYDFKHLYKLNRNKADTTGRGTRELTIMHEIKYANNTYKYTDISPAADADFYGNFQTDIRGIRHYIQHQSLENTLTVNTFKSRKSTNGATAEQKDLLEVGLLHRYNLIDQEVRETNLNEVFALGRWQIAPGERLRLKTYAHLGLLGSAGDYRAEGTLSFDLGKAGKLSANALQQLARPTLIQNSFIVSQREVYTNEFKKSLSTEIGGSYELPLVNLKAEVKYQLLNNYVYFDTLAAPQQADGAISVGRLTIQQNVNLGAFHLDNQITLQQSDSDFIRIPPVLTRNSLYFAGNIFKNALFAKIGFDLRLNSPYSPYGYQPLNGQFILQDQQSVNWQPLADVFLGVKVKKVRVLVRYDNFIPVLNRRDYYFQIADYPAPHGYFRWAVSWQFVD